MKPSPPRVLLGFSCFLLHVYSTLTYSCFFFWATESTGAKLSVFGFFVVPSIFWLREYLFTFYSTVFFFSTALTCRFVYLTVLSDRRGSAKTYLPDRRLSFGSGFLDVLRSSSSLSLASGVTIPSTFFGTVGNRMLIYFYWIVFILVLVCYFCVCRTAGFCLVVRVLILVVICGWLVVKFVGCDCVFDLS